MKSMVISKINTALIFTFNLQMAFAQIYVEQTTGRPQHEATTVSVYGPDASKKKIPLSRIKGSPFWKEEWQLASLYDNNAQRINIVPVRLNLATNELHFMWKEQELVAGDNTKINLIVFHNNNDSSSIGTMFIKNIPDLVLDKKPLTAFVQVMNTGNCQLLKYTSRGVYPGEDSLFGTQKTYIFRDVNFYFLKTGHKVEKIKKLNTEHFLEHIPEGAAYKEWIKQNNLSFKKDEDLVFFLNYYNAQQHSFKK
ncbi:MAG: hypothetical protein ACXWWC_02275 [Chitinophagaceae bacterium]